MINNKSSEDIEAQQQSGLFISNDKNFNEKNEGKVTKMYDFSRICTFFLNQI